MFNSPDLTQLLVPVIYRSQANISEKVLGFSDRFADYVIHRVEAKFHCSKTRAYYGREHIARCAWIDQQLLSYLKKTQKIEGIEINGGLSTRFHRLCEQLEWPQFSWCVVNTPEVDKCLQSVFPDIDNHRYIACEAPQQHALGHIKLQENKHTIIIVGEQTPLKHWDEFMHVYTTLQKLLSENIPYIDIILTHTVDNFLSICHSCQLSVHELAKQPKSPIVYQLFNTMIAVLDQTGDSRKATTCRLRIRKEN